MSLVSVVVPCFNCETTVEKSIRSILDQKHEEIEIIAVDDGSTDRSGEILDALARSDSRLSVHHTAHHGVSHARNVALRNCRGEYIGFVDADDSIQSCMFDVLVSEAEHESADIVISRYQYDANQNYIGDVHFHGSVKHVMTGERLRDCLLFRLVGPSRLVDAKPFGFVTFNLYRKPLIDRLNLTFHTDVDFGEDILFNLTYLSACHKAVCTSDDMYHYVQDNPQSLTHKLRPNFMNELLYLYNQIATFCTEHGYVEQLEQRLGNRMILSLNQYVVNLLSNMHIIDGKQLVRYLKNALDLPEIHRSMAKHHFTDDHVLDRIWCILAYWRLAALLLGFSSIRYRGQRFRSEMEVRKEVFLKRLFRHSRMIH